MSGDNSDFIRKFNLDVDDERNFVSDSNYFVKDRLLNSGRPLPPPPPPLPNNSRYGKGLPDVGLMMEHDPNGGEKLTFLNNASDEEGPPSNDNNNNNNGSFDQGSVENTHNASRAEGHKPTSKIATFANLIKGNIGTGILSLPYAMKNAGLVVGTVGLLLAGFLCTYAMHQLLSVYRKVLKTRPNRELDYADVVEACFEDAPSPRIRSLAKTAKNVVNFFLVFTQVGVCCIYLNFSTSMVKGVVEAYTNIRLSLLMYQAITTALLIPYCFVRHLHVLAIFSTIGNFMTIFSLIVIMQYVFRNLKPYETLPLAKGGGEFFLFLGSALFAYESITFVLPFEVKMKDRVAFHYWNGLMSLGMVCIIVLYTAVAFYSYLAFGNESQLVLKNLPDYWLYNSLRVVYAICIFLSYNLQLFIPIQILWPPIREKVAHRPFLRQYGEYMLRTSLVLLSFVLAAGVPCLEQMISLVGSLAISSLSLVFPPIIDIIASMPGSVSQTQPSRNEIRLSTFDPAMNDTKPVSVVSVKRNSMFPDAEEQVSRAGFCWTVVRDSCIIFIGITASIVGTYIVVDEIIGLLRVGHCHQ